MTVLTETMPWRHAQATASSRWATAWTPTLKVERGAVTDCFGDLVEEVYAR